MYEIRTRNSVAALERQQRGLVEISASGDGIPLKFDWHEHWCTVPDDFKNVYPSIYDFAVRPDDVFVVTFPKSGTTWMQEAAWLIMNNLDFDTANGVDLLNRSVFMDISGLHNKLPINSIKYSAELVSPRLLKSHLPAHLLPKQVWEKKSKIIYCAREPKDVFVSFFHFHRNLGTWEGNIDQFLDDFLGNELMYTPYWPHVMAFWQMRHEEHIFLTTYEEMQKDLASVLQKLCTFLEKPILTEPEMAKMLNHLSFESMRDNKRTNFSHESASEGGLINLKVNPDLKFMRRGIVGSHKAELTDEQRQRIDEWTERFLNKYNMTPEQFFD